MISLIILNRESGYKMFNTFDLTSTWTEKASSYCVFLKLTYKIEGDFCDQQYFKNALDKGYI